MSIELKDFPVLSDACPDEIIKHCSQWSKATGFSGNMRLSSICPYFIVALHVEMWSEARIQIELAASLAIKPPPLPYQK